MRSFTIRVFCGKDQNGVSRKEEFAQPAGVWDVDGQLPPPCADLGAEAIYPSEEYAFDGFVRYAHSVPRTDLWIYEGIRVSVTAVRAARPMGRTFRGATIQTPAAATT